MYHIPFSAVRHFCVCGDKGHGFRQRADSTASGVYPGFDDTAHTRPRLGTAARWGWTVLKRTLYQEKYWHSARSSKRGHPSSGTPALGVQGIRYGTVVLMQISLIDSI